MSNKQVLKDPSLVFDNTMDKLWYGKHAILPEYASETKAVQRTNTAPARSRAESRVKFQSMKEIAQGHSEHSIKEIQSTAVKIQQENGEEQEVQPVALQSVQVPQTGASNELVHKMMIEVFNNVIITQNNFDQKTKKSSKKAKSEKVNFGEKIAQGFKRAFSVSSKVNQKPFDINALKNNNNNNNKSNINIDIASDAASFYTLEDSNADYMSTMSHSQVGGSSTTHSPSKSQNEVDNIFSQKNIQAENNITNNFIDNNINIINNNDDNIQVREIHFEIANQNQSSEQLLFQHRSSSDIENKNNINNLNNLNNINNNNNNSNSGNINNSDQYPEEAAISIENFHGRTEEIDAELDEIVLSEIKQSKSGQRSDSEKVYCCSCLRQPF